MESCFDIKTWFGRPLISTSMYNQDKSWSLVSTMKLKSTTTWPILPIWSFFPIYLDDLLILLGLNFIEEGLITTAI